MARYIDHTQYSSPPPFDPKAELITSLTKLINSFPPQDQYNGHSCHGLYSGPTSIAYLFYTLSKSLSTLCISNADFSLWARTYLTGSRPQIDVKPSRCGIANETLANLAVSAAVMKETSFVEKFLSNVPALLDPNADTASNEWLYGRAGTLYLLRLVRTTASPTLTPAIDKATTAIIDRIMAEGPPWYWHGKEYLGAVHGSIGIVAQIMLSDPSRAPRLMGLLEELLDAQDPETGNWPSSVESGNEKLVQFCHGAPGFVIALVAIRKQLTHLPKPPNALLTKIDSAIEKGRKCIYDRGLLTKQPSLCHGAVGNAIALEGKQREMFMRWASDGMIEKGLSEGWYVEGDDQWGLFCGEAGRAWVWGILAGEEEEGEEGMVGFSDV